MCTGTSDWVGPVRGSAVGVAGGQPPLKVSKKGEI